MIDAGASQPWAFMASLTQKPNMVIGVHVLRSTGVTSISILVQSLASPKVVGCCGRTHPESFLFLWTSSLTWSLAVTIRFLRRVVISAGTDFKLVYRILLRLL